MRKHGKEPIKSVHIYLKTFDQPILTFARRSLRVGLVILVVVTYLEYACKKLNKFRYPPGQSDGS